MSQQQSEERNAAWENAPPRRIKKISDLPKWFSLDKYDSASTLSTKGWYWQIAARTDLYQHYVWHIPDDIVKSGFFNKEEYIAKELETNRLGRGLWELIQERPILDFDSSGFADKNLGHVVSEPKPGVYYASLEDVRMQLAGLAIPEEDIASRILNRERPKPLQPCPLVQQQANGPMFHLLLSVDLNIPERFLLENFAELIRKAKAIEENQLLEGFMKRKPDFSEWIRIGLLPYLDLKIWELKENTQITNRVMAHAIFPPGEGGEEVVRKTTEKLGAKILDGQMAELLAALSLAEQQQA